MSGKILDKDLYIKNLEGYVTEFSKSQKILGKLVAYVEKNVPQEQGTEDLWETVNKANELLYGPTRSYVDQG
jgi:hypothetical protein|tara:strand:- start:430 stop:645 length:216 start_codon:yes stop_codon:yes gene_type:complete